MLVIMTLPSLLEYKIRIQLTPQGEGLAYLVQIFYMEFIAMHRKVSSSIRLRPSSLSTPDTWKVRYVRILVISCIPVSSPVCYKFHYFLKVTLTVRIRILEIFNRVVAFNELPIWILPFKELLLMLMSN